MSLQYPENINALATTSATVANSAAIAFDVSKRQMRSIQFVRANHTSGSSAFGVEVSNDGTNWIVYNRLIPNLTGTNSQTDAYTAAPTLSSNTSSIYFFPAGDYFRMIRVFATLTTDGSAQATIQCAG